jgi:hypothetical protein
VQTEIQKKCIKLRKAYEEGLLGNQTMPEDTKPEFATEEEKFGYFTLPMSLNYQRNSYSLWNAAKLTFEDTETKPVFSVTTAASMTQDELRPLLAKYKVSLQPNKHTTRRRKRTAHGINCAARVSGRLCGRVRFTPDFSTSCF